MLLQHPWLAPLTKIDTISEEDEEEAEAAAAAPPTEQTQHTPANGAAEEDGTQWVDKEVGQWVREQLRKKREGLLGKAKQPALHAAPLDAVPSSKPSNRGAVAV